MNGYSIFKESTNYNVDYYHTSIALTEALACIKKETNHKDLVGHIFKGTGYVYVSVLFAFDLPNNPNINNHLLSCENYIHINFDFRNGNITKYLEITCNVNGFIKHNKKLLLLLRKLKYSKKQAIEKIVRNLVDEIKNREYIDKTIAWRE